MMEGAIVLLLLLLLFGILSFPVICLVLLIKLKNEQHTRLNQIESKLRKILELNTKNKFSEKRVQEKVPEEIVEPEPEENETIFKTDFANAPDSSLSIFFDDEEELLQDTENISESKLPPELEFDLKPETKPETKPQTEYSKALENSAGSSLEKVIKTAEDKSRKLTSKVSPLQNFEPVSDEVWRKTVLEEREKTEFEKKAEEVLRKIWMWIIVGDDFRKEGVSVEYAVATSWLVRVAIIIILTGIAFFLKYSIEKNLMPPTGRVCIALATGLGMLLAGLKISRKKYHLIGMGLIGGGLATLYFSIFAASSMYHLIGTLIAFALMILITIVAGVLSVRLNSLLVAILGVIGGYCTPVMLSTGTKNLEGLFGYLLLLGVGVLYIARYKDWKLLNFLSFIFTYGLFFVALNKFYIKADFPVVITFSALFFLLFSALPLLYNILRNEKTTVIELVAMLANTVLFLGASYNLIIAIYDRSYVAIVSLSLAAFYIAQIILFLKKKVNDRNLLIVLSGFASFGITVTVPLLLSGEWITAAWALQGMVFLWMSVKMKSNFIRTVAYIIYTIAFFRLVGLDFASNFVKNTSNYWDGLIARFTSMGIFTASIGAGYWLLKRNTEDQEGLISEKNDIKELADNNQMIKIFFWVAFAFLFVYLHFEFYNFSRNFYAPIQMPLLTSIWLGAILFFAFKYYKTLSQVYITLIGVFSLGLFIKLFFVDLNFWDFFPAKFIYRGDYSFEAAAMRLLDFMPVIAVYAYGMLMTVRLKQKKIAEIFGVGAIGLLFIYLTFELNTFLSCYVPDFRAGGISILWGLFALSLIIAGIFKRMKELRYAGLILFTVTALKIFLSDLAHLSPIYRIVAFIILGLAMLGGAFIYIRFKEVFDTEKGKESDEN
jgi:uncharacterized membrane protein